MGTQSEEALQDTQSEIDVNADRIERGVARLATSGFAGITVCRSSRAVVMFWSGVIPASIEELIAEASVKVEVRSAPHSIQEINALIDRVEADLTYWLDQGISIVELIPSGTGIGVAIGVEKPTDLARVGDLIRARYRDDPIQVYEAGGFGFL